MNSCPTSHALRLFERGELIDAEGDPIGRHVQSCARCRRRIERFRQADPDTRILRGLVHESQTAGPGSARSSVAFIADAAAPAKPARETLARALESAVGDAGAQAWPIADYQRVQLCGEGAFGSVWAVRDRVGVFRALKILDMHKMSRAKVSCRESTALETYCRRVGRHPYLIDVHHVGIVGEQLYYTMELADNDVTKQPVESEFPAPYRPLTLAAVIRRRRISPDTAIEIARRLLRGLSKLHNLDLVHRDIKPTNIIFVKRRPKLADIGMVTPGSDAQAVTGTPRYMPPDRKIDKSADTFAIGKVLHEMIAGSDGGDFPDLRLGRIGESLKWDLSKIGELIRRAGAPQAADRYATAPEMLDDLEACAEFPFPALFAENSETEPGPPLSRPVEAGSWTAVLLRAIPWLAGLIAFVLLLDRLLPRP